MSRPKTWERMNETVKAIDPADFPRLRSGLAGKVSQEMQASACYAIIARWAETDRARGDGEAVNDPRISTSGIKPFSRSRMEEDQVDSGGVVAHCRSALRNESQKRSCWHGERSRRARLPC